MEGFDIHYSTLLGNGLLMPLLITLAYIFIIPYPAKFVYSFWKNKQKEIQEIKQKIDDETPLTKEQSKKIRQDFKKLESIYYDNLLRNKDTKSINIDDEKSLKESDDISKYEIKILDFLSHSPHHYTRLSDIINSFNDPESKINYYLDKLCSKKYISSEYNDNTKNYQYIIEKKGIEYLVLNEII